ncbi:hypothetical protein [uncultured Shewanella sp.]
MDTHAALYKQGQDRLDYLRQFAQRQPVSLQQKNGQHWDISSRLH